MTTYALSPAAQADLELIWDYTAERWGVQQARRYVLGIRDACQALASGRRHGRTIDEIRPGYLKFLVGSHILLYRFTNSGSIDVIRILHQRMDVQAQIEG